MTAKEALEKLLPSFVRYYNIKTEEVAEPFSAEAEFYTHDESYFLFKEAKMFLSIPTFVPQNENIQIKEAPIQIENQENDEDYKE